MLNNLLLVHPFTYADSQTCVLVDRDLSETRTKNITGLDVLQGGTSVLFSWHQNASMIYKFECVTGKDILVLSSEVTQVTKTSRKLYIS